MGARRRDMAASRRRLTASGPRSCFGGFVVRSAPFLAPRELASDNIAERHRRTDRRAGSWIMPAEYRVGIDSDRVEDGDGRITVFQGLPVRVRCQGGDGAELPGTDCRWCDWWELRSGD